jgi:hypothetical protein
MRSQLQRSADALLVDAAIHPKCGICKFLSPKENEQTDKKVNHHCAKYNKRVRHLGHHPELPRLPECDEPI